MSSPKSLYWNSCRISSINHACWFFARPANDLACADTSAQPEFIESCVIWMLARRLLSRDDTERIGDVTQAVRARAGYAHGAPRRLQQCHSDSACCSVRAARDTIVGRLSSLSRL